ncbi:hypothetical protein PAAG_07493 [Paracoccidioides lutzii Pb01]|uniref:Uncharacterized protein n=1 Tax=Paracoccidioides lutzii (strain ATCC MYA-826 / Pb01) TaxID=502779 RepID=C1H9Q2_PARBA|nr:hypothetical protein PAAG_07493 [Paracoccidioides lutzii Pb01]EEH37075.2 hypothetical protein PAAG_07493 [Paracoccidioides lutzii Pb01]
MSHPYDHLPGINDGSTYDQDLTRQRAASSSIGNPSVVRAPANNNKNNNNDNNVPVSRVETPSRPAFFSRNRSLSRSSSQRQMIKPSISLTPLSSSTSANSTAASATLTVTTTGTTTTTTTSVTNAAANSPERRLPRESSTKRKGPSARNNIKGRGISRLIIPSLSHHSSYLTSPIDLQAAPPTPMEASTSSWGKSPNTANAGPDPFLSYGALSMPAVSSSGGSYGLQSASSIYANIHQMSSKRISTLDYLRKAHEGRVYWFNTVHFSKSDLSRLSYFEQRKLSRRATNYLLLGLSLPPILDVNSTPFEYLRALNALLLEFETFQQAHPADGNTSSSLTRARIPHMFKRSVHSGTKTRRTSSATEIGLPMQTTDPSDIKAMTGNIATSINPTSSASSYPSNSDSSDLLPGEEYTYLLTPTLPFDPDFFQTFSSLCDVLIDCYTRLMALVSGPSVCTAVVGEMFNKADSRLRKIMIAGVVREFEDASRSKVKSEAAGVSKVVLGGLLG